MSNQKQIEECQHNWIDLNSWEDVKGRMIKLEQCSKCAVVVVDNKGFAK